MEGDTDTAQDPELTALLTAGRDLYCQEMRIPCATTSYIPSDQLDKHHDKTCKLVIEVVGDSKINDLQTSELKKEMDALYLKFKKKNVMKLNYAEGETPAIGIHLGYKYCYATVFMNGEVVFIQNLRQRSMDNTPCYVTYAANGDKTIGEAAMHTCHANPKSTLYDVKKLIGKEMNDPGLQRDIKFWPFLVEDVEGFPKINVNGRQLYPEQVSADVLSEVRETAEQYLGMETGTRLQAVMTVPAFFNESQRDATRYAGELAGLDVLELLEEPESAILAYSQEWMDNANRKVLVFDMGAETFDTTVLDVTPNSATVLGLGGTVQLGGDDFDWQLCELCVRKFRDAKGIDLKETRNSVHRPQRVTATLGLEKLQTACEVAKRQLSSKLRTTLQVHGLYFGVGFQVEITRTVFEDLIKPYIETAIEILEQTLSEAKVKKLEIDEIIMVGGSTQIPKVQEELTRFFRGKEFKDSIPPEKVLGYGAALKAALLNGQRVADDLS